MEENKYRSVNIDLATEIAKSAADRRTIVLSAQELSNLINPETHRRTG